MRSRDALKWYSLTANSILWCQREFSLYPTSTHVGPCSAACQVERPVGVLPWRKMLDARDPQLTVESFIGWRVWAVTASRPWEDARGPVLRGAWGRLWPGPEMEARCLGPPVTASSFAAFLNEREKGEHSPPIPHPTCSCGIYARRTDGSDDLWVTRIANLPKAGGFVEMSGRVIEGSKGYRAQRARIVGPLEVWAPCAECDREATTVATEDGSFRGSCPEHTESGDVGIHVEDWMASILPHLGRRYGVPIIGREKGTGNGHR